MKLLSTEWLDEENNLWVTHRFFSDDDPPWIMISICDQKDKMGFCMDSRLGEKPYSEMLKEFRQFQEVVKNGH
jgi:hypothetical protein